MTPSEPVPELGLSWRMRDHEARLLADSLRSSRLTLLYAAAGASRRELLQDGVVPLVARRETDSSDDRMRESRVVEPFVDRRAAAGGGSGPLERAVFFDGWHGEPLGALLAAIRASFPAASDDSDDRLGLSDLLQVVSQRLSARLLIVLDAGERLWATGADLAATWQFLDAFGEAVNRGRLPVNFLLAVDDRYEAQMESLRRVVPRFDDSTVRLLGFEEPLAISLPRIERFAPRVPSEGAVAAPLLVPVPPTLSDAVVSAPPPARPRRKRPPKIPLAPSVPIKTDGVYAFIESTLTQTADASEPWHDAGTLPAAGASDSQFPSEKRAARPGRAVGLGAPGQRRVATQGAFDREIERPPAESPSPIDEWLDSVLAWCRRVLRLR